MSTTCPKYPHHTLLACLGVLLMASSALAADEDAFGKATKYTVPEAAAVKTQVEAYLKDSKATDEAKKAALALWSGEPGDATGPGLLKRLGATFAAVDDSAKKLVAITEKPYDGGLLPDVVWLDKKELSPFFQNNLRLLYGRWLGQERLYDEALTVLETIEPDKVVDPASLLFFKSVACHRLLKVKEGQEAIRGLLEDVNDSPQRYVALAGLMQQDLAAIKDGSLDDISRRMEDVERRLDLARAGKRVRRKEDEIVDMLDKLIEDIEKQQQKQQSPGAGGGGGGKQSTRPAGDSAILPGQGPGQTDRRNTQGSGWGELPPKEREEALQQLGKDFPAHYRAAIEQYFRRIANQPGAAR